MTFLFMYSAVVFLATTAAFAQSMTDYTGVLFPSNYALNTPIDSLPVHPNSDNYVASIGANSPLHPDFGTSWDDGGTIRPMGIPYNIVGSGQPFVPINFYSYDDESDPGPWPIPQNPYIETVFDWRDSTDGDRHMLIVDSSSHILYETGGVYGNSDGTKWQGGCGAVFDLNSNHLRQETWTSADAAGLPIFPLLIRYDEVARAMVTGGEIAHAIRFTVVNSQQAYVWPARHYASSSTDTNRSPMGLRFRLKMSFDISGFTPRMQVILRTMKKYGIIVADNGSNWFFQGTHDERWDDNELNSLKTIHGKDFEAVDIRQWTNRSGFDKNSGAVPPLQNTSVGSPHGTNPISELELYQNYPNPFNPTTIIRYQLPVPSHICLKIYDIFGREITTLVNEIESAGSQSVLWDGKNPAGVKVSSGLYFCRLQAGNSVYTRKLILLK
jgi:FlgD Ig-like domain